jgi:hypothetical protein
MSNVLFYDKFFNVDRTYWGSFEVWLLTSAYTFSATHTSATSDLQPHEVADSGYARITGCDLHNALTGTGHVGDWVLANSGADSAFGAFTTTDWEFIALVGDDGMGAGTDIPYMVIDAGSAQSLTAEALTIPSTVPIFTITGP